MNRRKRFLVVASVFTGLLLFPARISPVYADTLYVDGACADSDLSDELCDDGVTYRTIQAAVDAAIPGDVVEVAPGRYVEQLDIGKNLTLLGAGPCTVVESPGQLGKCFSIPGDNDEADYYAAVCVHDAGDARIRELVVDGAGKGHDNDRFVGIAYYNAGGVVDGVEITGIRHTPWSSGVYGDALHAYNGDGGARSLEITSCNVHDFQKNGLVLRGAGLAVNVTANTVVGHGPTDVTVQNGIVVWGAAGAVGPDNHVSGVSYVPGDSVASGILVYSGGADVLENVVSSSQVGIYLWQGSASISGNMVFASPSGVGTDSFWGMIVNDPPGAFVNPFDGDAPEAHLQATGLHTVATAVVNVTHNSLRCSGGSGSSRGLEAAAGYYGPDDLAFTATANTISGWDRGLFLNQCIEGCTGTFFESAAVNQNSIAGNTGYGLCAEGLTFAVDATHNWWGHNSGPYHGSSNPTAQGDAVSDDVNWAPWLKRTYLPLGARDSEPEPPGPELRVTSLVVEPSSLAAGQPVTITVEVQNVGAVAAGPFWVDLYDNPTPPPTQANQIWPYLCSGSLEDCYGIAWFLDGLGPGESAVLTSAAGYEEPQTHWLGHFVHAGRHDLYAFVDSWNGTVWYGGVLERNEGVDNRYGPVVACVAPGEGGDSLEASESVAPTILCRPSRP